MPKAKAVRKAVLVYQSGIANVFEVRSFNLSDYGRDAKRLLQADFRSCEWYSRGLKEAGCTLKVAHCNEAGDIISRKWTQDFDSAPFRDSMARDLQPTKPEDF